jgi:hypothetical protein
VIAGDGLSARALGRGLRGYIAGMTGGSLGEGEVLEASGSTGVAPWYK